MSQTVGETEAATMCETVDGDNTKNLIDELNELEGLNVWTREQSVLERQALDELKEFAKEDGELSDGDEKSGKGAEKPMLDVGGYIKRQEELKKRQVYKRSLETETEGKAIADRITKRQLNANRKRRRKLSDGGKRDCENNNLSPEPQKEDVEDCVKGEDSGSEYVPSDESDYEPGYGEKPKSAPKPKRPKTDRVKVARVLDDGLLKNYKKRLELYYDQLEKENALKSLEEETNDSPEEVEVRPGFKITTKIWDNLYEYQRQGVEWLWDLHKRSSGGVLGDEMGLGKTVQVIAFLNGLHNSLSVSNHGKYTGLGPTLIVCPSTVIYQWVHHFHSWAPEFRVAVLHQSGSFSGTPSALIKEMHKNKAIIITTYQSTLKHESTLKSLQWHYLILDEGHKIRNPNAKISKSLKEFRTPHRLILSGSPMQNNLQELWSVFDFTNPGMLGSLQVFQEHFVSPILQGGYMNATPMQESLALSMATALKNMITPYLLRRAKSEVKHDIYLPNKTENVLFCSLSDTQKDLYRGYLLGERVGSILGRSGNKWCSDNYTRANVLIGLTTLRKICNHPSLYLSEMDDDIDTNEEHDYKKSGKMQVVSGLLKTFKRQGHRVLLFTQSRAMIKIFEGFLKLQGYQYLKMDGTTATASRQPLIDKFNQDKKYDVFLLTTRVGGLGVNLTGADRVIIYDPDWNPATDVQARERAWRIGQNKDVVIYRLVTAGTIEEKIYQRQVFKLLLSNKVLLDPKTQKFFRSSDLHDLFSLQEEVTDPETANIFKNSRISLQNKIKEKNKSKHKKSKEPQFSEDKLKAMKELAAQIAKNISTKKEPDKKTLDQLELEEERKRKLEERAALKKLTPIELRQYNREKLLPEDVNVNKVDDCNTEISFTKALIVSEKTAEVYSEAKASKKNVEKATEKYKKITKAFKKDEKVVVDRSGNVDGDKIEGLVKLEVRKSRKKEPAQLESNDSYILNKLFSKNMVRTALQHDAVVKSGGERQNSIRIHTETQSRTDLALQALRKSRLNRWTY